MDKPKIMLAIPMYHTVEAGFMMSLLELLSSEYPLQVAVEVGTLIYMARTRLAKKAIDGGFDYILWLDSDMIFPADTVKKLVDKAVENDYDYISGIYFARALPTSPVICKEIKVDEDENGLLSAKATRYFDYPRDSFFEIAGGGFGCCLTKVSMIKDLAQQFGMSPFNPIPGLSEDYSFNVRATEAGYKMWCDSTIKCGHVGAMVFTEDTYLRQQEQCDS